MRRKQKRNILIAIVLVLLIIAGITTYYILTSPKEEEPIIEPKKEKYRINKVVEKNKLTFELINQESNVVEHTIILNNIEDPSFYEIITADSSKGMYYIVTENTVSEKYFRVYNKEFKKISEDLYTEDNQRKNYDIYEVLDNGNIKLTTINRVEENVLDLESLGDGYLEMNEYIYNQEGEVVSQSSNYADYLIPMAHTFAFDSKYVYVFGNHGELLEKEQLEKTSKGSYASFICTSKTSEPITGYDDQKEWLHYGSKGSNAKKYIFNYKENKLTIEDSNCVVE